MGPPMSSTKPITFPVDVAYVLPGLGRGGTEKHVADLASRLDRSRFSPCVLSTARGGPMEEELASRGIPVHILDYRGLSLHPARAVPLLGEALGFFRDFARILEERNVAILHSYLPAANILAMAVGLRSRTRVRIVSKRALCRYKEGHPVFSWFEELANLAADAVMVNSHAVAESVRRAERFAEGKMFLVYNGIEVSGKVSTGGSRPPLPADIEVPADALPITYVANLFDYKGHAVLVDAARCVADAFPSVRFLLVGADAGEMENLRRRIGEAGLSRHILLLGPRSDAAAIVSASRLVVHPSLQEGFSNAILEAMAAGKAVLATRVGGNPEAVEDGRTGLLVPPADPGALASAILELLRNTARAEAMGNAGRERVRERFSTERMVAAVEENYLELLEGRPLSRRV